MGSGDYMGLHDKMIQLDQAVQKYTGKSGTTAVPDMIKRLTQGEATNLISQKSGEMKSLTDYKFSSPIEADSKGLVFSVEVVNPLPERKIQPFLRLEKGSNSVGYAIFPVRDFKQNEKATLTVKYIEDGTFDGFYLDDLNGDPQHRPKFYNLKVYRGDHIETSSSENLTTVSSENLTTVKSALSALGDAVRHAVGKSNLMTIDDMIALLDPNQGSTINFKKMTLVPEVKDLTSFGTLSVNFTTPLPAHTGISVMINIVVTLTSPGVRTFTATIQDPTGTHKSTKSVYLSRGTSTQTISFSIAADDSNNYATAILDGGYSVAIRGYEISVEPANEG